MKAQFKLIVCLVTILSLLPIYSNVMASTDDVYFGVSLQRYVEEPADSAMLTLFAGNLSGKRITLDEISIFREGSDEPFRKIQVGKELTQLNTNLSSQDCKTMVHPNIDEVVDKNARAQFFKVNGDKLYMCIEEVNLSEILYEIRPDQVFRLTAIARFNVDGKEIAVEDKGVGYYAPRPIIKDATVESSDTSGDSVLAVPSGWSKIAPHVHTKYSDGAPTISVRTWMQTAAAAGLRGLSSMTTMTWLLPQNTRKEQMI